MQKSKIDGQSLLNHFLNIVLVLIVVVAIIAGFFNWWSPRTATVVFVGALFILCGMDIIFWMLRRLSIFFTHHWKNKEANPTDEKS